MTAQLRQQQHLPEQKQESRAKQNNDVNLSKLSITPSINLKRLYGVKLQNLNCSFDVVRPEGDVLPLKQIVKDQAICSNSIVDVTIMYAIRQPACPSCREHAVQLSDLAVKDRRLALLGTVKETGINDQEILKFYQEYFRGNPIYKDDKWNLYKALGARKLTMKEAMLGFFRSRRRFRQKRIESGKCATEGFLQGGILIFDRHGNLTFAMKEDFQELDMELIQAAVEETRRRSRSSSSKKSNTSSSTRSSSTRSSLGHDTSSSSYSDS